MSQAIAQVIRMLDASRSMTRALLCLLLCCVAAAIPRLARSADATPCNDAILKSLGDYVEAAHFGRLGTDGKAPGLVVREDCKVWPADPSVTLAVVAYTDQPGDGSDVDTWNVVTAMVDTHTAKVVAAAKEVGNTSDDTYRLGGYVLDTAPYPLSPTVRAFGVIDTNQKDVHCADAYSGPVLTLWIRDKDRLRPVFTTNLEGAVTTEGVACAGSSGPLHMENARMTIAVEKTRTNGFADLSITARVVPSYSDVDGDRKGPQRVRRVVLKYDGRTYGADTFRDFWYPDSMK